MSIELLHADCMDYMRDQPDNAFELAIVDPPYNLARFKNGLREGDRIAGNQTGSSNLWNNNEPTPEYFNELFRVSLNQVIWGANNFILPPTEYFCIWNKKQTVDNFATAEYAWVSMGLKKPAKMFDYGIHQHNADKGKIHPTQKPVKLYDWLLANYAKEGDRILDTHLGSGSSAIAAHYGEFDFVGMELDADYYKAACERFDRETAQVDMFTGASQ
jgi:site-specific DNA-methyltransferase (adenine-specific)